MAIKTSSYNSEKVVKSDTNLKDFLIWLRDHGIMYKTNDFHNRGWILDSVAMNDDEIIEKYKKEEL